MKVTNISKSSRVLYDKGGKRIEIEPGKSANMVQPPEEHYAFKIEKSNHVEKNEETKEEQETERRKE